mmetsp:Transcript_15041/g.30027  ORF Transcript_15041/g.30027 Transcript_15041/m.30027 type:complete len:233 (-) Transcript_15041:123-821(-)
MSTMLRFIGRLKGFMKGAFHFIVPGVSRYHQSWKGGDIFACRGPWITPSPSDSHMLKKMNSFFTNVSHGKAAGPRISSPWLRGVVKKKAARNRNPYTGTIAQCQYKKELGIPSPPLSACMRSTAISDTSENDLPLTFASSGGASAPSIYLYSHMMEMLVPTLFHAKLVFVCSGCSDCTCCSDEAAVLRFVTTGVLLLPPLCEDGAIVERNGWTPRKNVATVILYRSQYALRS